jgi:hemerythrin-like domain-containing protein
MSTTADVSGYLAIHRAIRSGAHALATAAGSLDPRDPHRLAAFGRYWHGYANEVLGHHSVEDDIFFPALVDRLPAAHEHMARLDAEHHLLDELMEAAAAAIKGFQGGDAPQPSAVVLGQLAHVMDEHLDYEDAEIIPLFARHFTDEEYQALHEAAVKSTGLGKQALFTVPFIGYWVTDEERQNLLGSAPLPFRVVYRLSRRSHDRLVHEALGESAVVEARSLVAATMRG